ncbi:MAG: isoleucine--tRNA ligase [bacterium]
MSNLPQLEEQVLKRWKQDKIFQKTLEKTKKGKRFVFFEGPPTANGQPGIHHVLARAFKDVIPRFKTMQGYFVERKAGWDTQGLPVELAVEKQIGVSGKQDIEKYGVAKFNEASKKSVWQYKEDWEKLTERIGFWLDMDNPYITYENDYIESLWWIFKQAWDKKLLIQGHKVVPHCPRCETALSSHEVAQGYEKVNENSVYVKFELVDEPNTFVLSWTTTPWTLPGNLALAVGSHIKYVKTPKNNKGEQYIIAMDLANQVLKDEEKLSGFKSRGGDPIQIISSDHLVGKKYKPLFEIEEFKDNDAVYQIYKADFVTTDEGTGVVHTAVMYGEDDYNLGTKVGLPKHHTVDEAGKFTDDVPGLAGQFVKSKKTEAGIVEFLKEKGLIYKEQMNEHDYPFCWRCHTPLLYYAKNSWFLKMSALREQLIKNNEQINWVPDYIKDGRFGEWLSEVKDWAISRERYWGTPIPVWECDKCDQKTCIGSFEELAKQTGKKLPKDFDPHKPFIDDYTITCDQCGGLMKRIPEVADTWFDSGSMPFAQWHYPFENKERIDKGVSFPADYIAEAIDQTRGWFYTLLAVSTILGHKEPPYKNVICLAHILDTKGKKMSKHIGNVVNPWEVINEYGADALRFQFFSMNQPGDIKLFDKKGTSEVVKKVFLMLSNIVSFYNLHEGKTNKDPKKSDNILDLWVLIKTELLTQRVTKHLEEYNITSASRQIADFITELSTWYVRRSRARFRNPGEDQEYAQATLQYVLQRVTVLLAPFTPMLADSFYQQTGGQLDSVHLEDWPEAKISQEAESVTENMDQARAIVELSHAIRAEAGIKVRQPLGQLAVKGKAIDKVYLELVQDELNVHEVVFAQKLPDEKEWQTKADKGYEIALDTTITDELREAGWVRELVRTINDERKKLGLQRSDHVNLQYQSDDKEMQGLFDRYAKELKTAVIADDIAKVDKLEQGKEVKLDKHIVRLQVVIK